MTRGNDFSQELMAKIANFKAEIGKIHESIGTPPGEMEKVYSELQVWLSDTFASRIGEEQGRLRTEINKFEEMWNNMQRANRALNKNVIVEKPSNGSYRQRIQMLSSMYEGMMAELTERENKVQALLTHLHKTWKALDHPILTGFEEVGDDVSDERIEQIKVQIQNSCDVLSNNHKMMVSLCDGLNTMYDLLKFFQEPSLRHPSFEEISSSMPSVDVEDLDLYVREQQYDKIGYSNAALLKLKTRHDIISSLSTRRGEVITGVINDIFAIWVSLNIEQKYCKDWAAKLNLLGLHSIDALCTALSERAQQRAKWKENIALFAEQKTGELTQEWLSLGFPLGLMKQFCNNIIFSPNITENVYEAILDEIARVKRLGAAVVTIRPTVERFLKLRDNEASLAQQGKRAYSIALSKIVNEVQKRLPQLEAELREKLSNWHEVHGIPFYYNEENLWENLLLRQEARENNMPLPSHPPFVPMANTIGVGVGVGGSGSGVVGSGNCSTTMRPAKRNLSPSGPRSMSPANNITNQTSSTSRSHSPARSTMGVQTHSRAASLSPSRARNGSQTGFSQGPDHSTTMKPGRKAMVQHDNGHSVGPDTTRGRATLRTNHSTNLATTPTGGSYGGGFNGTTRPNSNRTSRQPSQARSATPIQSSMHR